MLHLRELCSCAVVDLHFHEAIITRLQISLRQTNPHWNYSTLFNASALDPISRKNCELLFIPELELTARVKQARYIIWIRGTTLLSPRIT
jgi:hypothetical protein